jgi:hypothetical protein
MAIFAVVPLSYFTHAYRDCFDHIPFLKGMTDLATNKYIIASNLYNLEF